MEIVNRVAQSTLITLDLESLYDSRERITYDLSNNLYQGLILKEKEFRAFLAEHDWSMYQDKNVSVVCTADAIVPTWAFMLVAMALQPYAHRVIVGDPQEMENTLFREAIQKIDIEQYRGKKVVVKGCSNYPVPVAAYCEVSVLLKPVVASLMFGEPCSTVPLYKIAKT